MNSTGAIILAAGSASRMGRPKQLLKIDGKSLIRRSVQAALDAKCEQVVVVTGAHAELVEAELKNLPITISFNPNWSAGMGTSIRTGLSALIAINPNISAAIILLCDQPHLSADIIRNLTTAWSASHKPMAACEYANSIGPPCRFAREMFDALAKIGDADGAKKLLHSNRQNVLTIPWPEGADDLDTPEDWQRLCQTDSPPAQ